MLTFLLEWPLPMPCPLFGSIFLAPSLATPFLIWTPPSYMTPPPESHFLFLGWDSSSSCVAQALCTVCEITLMLLCDNVLSMCHPWWTVISRQSHSCLVLACPLTQAQHLAHNKSSINICQEMKVLLFLYPKGWAHILANVTLLMYSCGKFNKNSPKNYISVYTCNKLPLWKNNIT